MSTVRNRDFAVQLVSFAGMKWGSISPTDIDGFVEFGGKLFVFIEAKHGDSEMDTGQRLAYERLCDACHRPPYRYAAVLQASHSTSNDVVLGDQRVVKYRWNGSWRTPQEQAVTVMDAVNTLRARALGQ
jgi:hypothetical protein